MKRKKVELVAPAGSWAGLQTAIKYGADSVYFGVRDLNMRHSAENFDLLELDKAMKLLHKNNRKGYLTLNTIIYNNELSKIRKILKKAKKAGVDAVIAWDMAVLKIAKELKLKVHLSTQASVSNFSAVKFYSLLGVKRIVLARECSFEAIKDIIKSIRKEKIGCEIETFIHGAMCVSLSGRCFLSSYAFAKSANRGKCIQPCRRRYLITDLEEKGNKYILGKDYILSPKDLCTIDFIDRLIEIGVTSFKIEGRMRNPEYVKEVTSVYRTAIDAFFKDSLSAQLKKNLKRRLNSVYNKGFTNGFFWETPNDTGAGPVDSKHEKIFLGEVVNFYNKNNVAAIHIRNQGVKIGDRIAIYGKSTPLSIAEVKEMQIAGKAVTFTEKGKQVGIKLPFKVRRNDKVFFYKQKHA
ncbi:MAG: peptidase U32 family protein [Candidatus Gorgyraea atricola]|nr:peptidase U32 family protein [Candidatus Gorgyraea atricola]